MRILVLALAILGALAAGGAAGVWFMQGGGEVATQELRLKIPATKDADRAEARANLPVLVAMPYFLGAGCLLGLLAAGLALGYRGKSAGVLLLLAATGPLALAGWRLAWLTKKPDWLMEAAGPCAALLLGGLLALLLRPKPALAPEGPAAEDKEGDEDEDEED